jgi:hypothetical protein
MPAGSPETDPDTETDIISTRTLASGRSELPSDMHGKRPFGDLCLNFLNLA